jgi:hypothetical protein
MNFGQGIEVDDLDESMQFVRDHYQKIVAKYPEKTN